MNHRLFSLTPPLDPISAAIAWMNERFSIVSDGGRPIVVCVTPDPMMENRERIQYFTFAAFREIWGHLRVWAHNDQMKYLSFPLGAFWLDHPDHRIVEGIVFDPTDQTDREHFFNLWSGFAPLALQQQIDMPDASWGFLKAHIAEVICHHNVEHYEYVLSWMAQGVQFPGIPAGVALVLRGGEGIGKGVFARTYGKLFGAHWSHLNDSRQLTGTFNSHLEGSIVIFADEAIGTSDKAAVSKLKTLITEPTMFIEAKYRTPYTAINHARVIMASNEDWVVPAGKDARRYCVLDVDNAQRDHREYFQQIDDEMQMRGGYGAMLTDLYTRDLRTFDIFAVPRTAALLDQKMHTLSVSEHWWLDKLREGRLLWDHETWQQTINRNELRIAYLTAMKSVAREHRAVIGVAARMSKFLKSVVPSLSEGPRLSGERTWIIPPLNECRAHFEKLLGQPVNWED